jgi:hypothetical protein
MENQAVVLSTKIIVLLLLSQDPSFLLYYVHLERLYTEEPRSHHTLTLLDT